MDHSELLVVITSQVFARSKSARTIRPLFTIFSALINVTFEMTMLPFHWTWKINYEICVRIKKTSGNRPSYIWWGPNSQ